MVIERHGIMNVGVAAHITAAPPGGPRYDPTLSSDRRVTITTASGCASIRFALFVAKGFSFHERRRRRVRRS
jgi:hypothetical protein